MAKWRRHTVEFKRQVVERMKICENIQSLARELKLALEYPEGAGV